MLMHKDTNTLIALEYLLMELTLGQETTPMAQTQSMDMSMVMVGKKIP